MYCSSGLFSLILYKEHTTLKSRELEELPRFWVTSWQPYLFLRSVTSCYHCTRLNTKVVIKI